jgi:hypothetical protein
MQTTFYFKSAQEISEDMLEKIKHTYQSKSITITVDDSGLYELTENQKQILDERLNEDPATYLSAEETIEQLKKKYGV